jgi:hypothetical protein
MTISKILASIITFALALILAIPSIIASFVEEDQFQSLSYVGLLTTVVSALFTQLYGYVSLFIDLKSTNSHRYERFKINN